MLSIDGWDFAVQCSITATVNGVPCGMATLYLIPIKNWLINVNLELSLEENIEGRVWSRIVKKFISSGKAIWH